MSDTKFTPGPWYISVDARNCPSVRTKGGYVAFAPSIANYGDPLRYMDEASEIQANARLIAAAPDMYEALIDIARYLGNRPFKSDGEELIIYRCKATIAKAEGKDA